MICERLRDLARCMLYSLRRFTVSFYRKVATRRDVRGADSQIADRQNLAAHRRQTGLRLFAYLRRSHGESSSFSQDIGR
jgi:hypothetical protein